MDLANGISPVIMFFVEFWRKISQFVDKFKLDKYEFN